jgi:two-component system, LytTR family, sensor histidine kinase AlgZ
MHPILAKYSRLTVYLLAWVPVAALLVYLLGMSGHLTWGEACAIVIPLVGFDAFICLSPWYLCRTLPPRASGALKLGLNVLGAALASGLLLVVAGKGIALSLTRWWPHVDVRFSSLLPLVFAVGTLMYLLATALHYVLLSVEESQQAATRENEALVLAREAELRALRAQINPHFLFNSLNSISALTTVDAARARDMCILLSDFLRKTLSAGDQDTIPLAEEVALIRTYLAVEQIRFGARLSFDIDVEESCNRCLLPPLLLQPLIENAIKHGISGLTEGGVIGVRARANERFLRLTVENNFDTGYRALRRSGIGLANVRSRLEARYDGDARMDAGAQDDRYRVEIVMPVSVAAAVQAQVHA